MIIATSVDRTSSDPSKEKDESVQHTLNQGEGDHIAVSNMTYLVSENSFSLFAGHASQEPCADGN